MNRPLSLPHCRGQTHHPHDDQWNHGVVESWSHRDLWRVCQHHRAQRPAKIQRHTISSIADLQLTGSLPKAFNPYPEPSIQVRQKSLSAVCTVANAGSQLVLNLLVLSWAGNGLCN